MEYERADYFEEHEQDDVNGFTILRANEGKYHIAEKWLASNASETEDKWMSYLIPESDLLDRIEAGHCSKKGTLTDDQFEAVANQVNFEPRIEA